MICMAYLSTAAHPPGAGELDAILSASRRNNLARNVTGMLCHYDGSYLQFLEGEADDVDAIYRRIQGDRRHEAMIQLYRRPVAERLFGEWSMALARVDAMDEPQRAFCRGLRDLEVATTEDHRQLVEPFLDSFRSWMR